MNCDHIVALNWGGCGSTGAFWFLGAIGRPYVWDSSQFATSPMGAVANTLNESGNLDDAWPAIKNHLVSFEKLRGFTSWPYNLFYKQWDEDPDYNAKFIFWDRPAEDWAKVEFAFQCMRGLGAEFVQYHLIREWVYGTDLNYNSPVAVWQAWVDRYKKHNSEIRARFEGRDNYMYIDVTIDPLTLGDQICEFIGIQNVSHVHYPGPDAVGGERSGLIDESGWDETFTSRWNEYSPQVNW